MAKLSLSLSPGSVPVFRSAAGDGGIPKFDVTLMVFRLHGTPPGPYTGDDEGTISGWFKVTPEDDTYYVDSFYFETQAGTSGLPGAIYDSTVNSNYVTDEGAALNSFVEFQSTDSAFLLRLVWFAGTIATMIDEDFSGSTSELPGNTSYEEKTDAPIVQRRNGIGANDDADDMGSLVYSRG